MGALGVNETGSKNIAIGKNALDANTIADNNTAIGNAALGANSTGTGNTSVGALALNANTIADNNTAIGKKCFASQHRR